MKMKQETAGIQVQMEELYKMVLELQEEVESLKAAKRTTKKAGKNANRQRDLEYSSK